MAEKNEWKFGLNIPLAGEIPFTISKNFDLDAGRQFLRLVGGSGLDHKFGDIQEINSLFFQFYIGSKNKTEVVRSFNSSQYSLEVQNNTNKNFSKYNKQYSLRLMRSSFFVNWTIFELDIIYSECFSAKQH